MPCLSYFALRRCIEHHNAIPHEKIRLLFRKLTLLVEDEEIRELPHNVEAGGRVGIRIDDDHKDFKKGKPVELTEVELEQIVFSIKATIAQELANLASTALNARAARAT